MERINNIIRIFKEEYNIPYELFINFIKNGLEEPLELIRILNGFKNIIEKVEDQKFDKFVFKNKAWLIQHDLVEPDQLCTKENIIENINKKIKNLRHTIKFKLTEKKNIFNKIFTQEDYNYIFNLTKEEYDFI